MKLDEVIDSMRYIRLYMSGDYYDYGYNILKREVTTLEFPNIPVERVVLRCGRVINHDMLVATIEDKLGIKNDSQLSDSFS
jgi:hypothetical protein